MLVAAAPAVATADGDRRDSSVGRRAGHPQMLSLPWLLSLRMVVVLLRSMLSSYYSTTSSLLLYIE